MPAVAVFVAGLREPEREGVCVWSPGSSETLVFE